MLEQLDLFSTFTEEQEEAPGLLRHPEERKLVPPQVILQESMDTDTPEPETIGTDKPLNNHIDAAEQQRQLFPPEPEWKPEASGLEEEMAETLHQPVQTGIFLEIKPEITEKPKSGRGRKPNRDVSVDADQPQIPEESMLFGKPFYGIGEVAAMFRMTTAQLRYWESEFDVLSPRKNGNGDTFYRPEDIKTLKQIHHLLRNRKLTVEAARIQLKNNDPLKHKEEVIRQLEQLRRFLMEMKSYLLLS